MDEPYNFLSISTQTVDRYSKRFSELGHDVRSLGWGSSSQQVSRFHNLTKALNLSGKSVVDIGCGFGDLFAYIQSEEIPIKSYTGWDINEEFIMVAKHTHLAPGARFEVFDVLNDNPKPAQAEIGVMLGLLNYNYGDQEINLAFTKQMLLNAFKTVTHCLFVDFISTHRDAGYPYEDFIYYQDPSLILKLGLSMTSDLRLLHDYAPIPQKEFSLILHK